MIRAQVVMDDDDVHPGARTIDGAKDGKLDPRPDEVLRQDELVMVLMTRGGFDQFRDLGLKLGLNPQATMGYALRALEKLIADNVDVLDTLK
jgi:hypothetical protein